MTVTVWSARENLQSFSNLWRFQQGQAVEFFPDRDQRWNSPKSTGLKLRGRRVSSMQVKQPEAQQPSSEKSSQEELQNLLRGADEAAPIDFATFGRRLSEIIMRAVRGGRKKLQF
jgi:hypothetical protein